MDLAFFRAEGDALVANEISRSAWKEDQIHGVAVSGALARAVEQAQHAAGRTDLRPTRFTVDLFKAASTAPASFATRVVREGPRILVVDVEMAQGGEPVARASALFLRPTESAPGEVWQPEDRPAAPPIDVVPASDEPRVPFMHSSAGWSQHFGEHQNASRKQSWNTALPVVSGEPVTPFQAVASIADGASLVTNWGSGGVEYINTDISLALSREPVGLEIGLAALDRVEQDGIAVGTATVFDREGQLGNIVVTSLANARRAVDFERLEYTDDGERRTTTRA